MIRKMLLYICAALLLLPFCVSCANGTVGSQDTDTETETAADTESETEPAESETVPAESETEPIPAGDPFCGYPVVLTDGAVLADDVLSGKAADGEKFCGGLYQLGGAGADVSVIVLPKATTGGGIMFRYKDDGNYYRLEFKTGKKEIRLVRAVDGETTELGLVSCILEKDKPIDVKFSISGNVCRIYLHDFDEADKYPKFDILLEDNGANGLFFDCGSDSAAFSELAVSDYSGVTEYDPHYVNPVLTGADPFILEHDGTYYLYSTYKTSQGYVVYTSDNLRDWTDSGFCLKREDCYATESSNGFWAPEVYYVNGRFYLFYTVDQHLGIATSDSPLGPFKGATDGYLFENRAIDAHLFIDDDGQAYLYYVRMDDGNEVYGCRFDLDTFETSDEVLLVTPQEGSWEYVYGKTAEGPCMIKHNGTYYLTYTCNDYHSPDYAVGYMTSSSPLSGFKRFFKKTPILKKSIANGVSGPGHHSFFHTADGELMIVYHKHFSMDTVADRQICLDRCTFVTYPGEAVDRLIVCGPTVSPQALPD